MAHNHSNRDIIMNTKLLILLFFLFTVAGCQNNQTTGNDLTPDNKTLALQAGMSDEAFARFDELISFFGEKYELEHVRQPSDISQFQAMSELLEKADAIWCVVVTNHASDGSLERFFVTFWSEDGVWVDAMMTGEEALNSQFPPAIEEKRVWQATGCLN
jgi:hypothetical protein